MKISSADRILSLWFVRVSLPFASSDRGEHVTCLCLHRCQPAGVRAPLGKKLTALVKGALRRAKIERELCVQICVIVVCNRASAPVVLTPVLCVLLFEQGDV